MTLQQPPTQEATPVSHPLIRVVAVAALLIAAVLVMTAIVGVAGTGPSLDLVSDPAGVLPF